MVQSNAIFLLDVTEVTTLALWRIGGPIELPFDKERVAKRLRSWAGKDKTLLERNAKLSLERRLPRGRFWTVVSDSS